LRTVRSSFDFSRFAGSPRIWSSNVVFAGAALAFAGGGCGAVGFAGGGGGGGGVPFTGGGGGVGGFGLGFGAGGGADFTEGDGGDSVVAGVVGSAEVGCGAARESRSGAGDSAGADEGGGGDSVVGGVVGSAEVGCGAARESRSGAGDSAGADEGDGGDSVVGVVDSAEAGGRSAREAPSAFAAISESPLFCMTDHRRSIMSRLASFCAARAAVVLASSLFSCDSRACATLAVLRDCTVDRSILSLVRGPKKSGFGVLFFCALFRAKG
jgi:hypothetical protein